MSVNQELTSLWQDISDAVRNKDGNSSTMTPSQIPGRILAIVTPNDTGELAIYASGPSGTTVTATHEDGSTFTDTTDSNGKAVIWVNKPGKYTITGVTSSGSATTSAVLIVSEASLEIITPPVV